MATTSKLQGFLLPVLPPVLPSRPRVSCGSDNFHGSSCSSKAPRAAILQSQCSRRERLPEWKGSVCGGGSGLLLASAFKQERCSMGCRLKRAARRRASGSASAAAGDGVQVDDGVVKNVASLFNSFQVYPPTWSSSLAVNVIIFTLALPLLLAGLAPGAIATAFALGTVVWRAFGSSGFWIVALYYLIGSSVTKLRMKQKEAEGIAERNKGKRTPASVYGSGAAGFVCALGAIFELGGPAILPLWQLGYVASFCTKLADTTSSEVGKAYGKTTYLVTTFEKVPRGTEGAVSVEGTLAGFVGAVFLTTVALVTGQVDVAGAIACIIASQIANVFEGVIGASLQGKEGWEWLNNDLVNVLNISIGAALAMLLRGVIPIPLI